MEILKLIADLGASAFCVYMLWWILSRAMPRRDQDFAQALRDIVKQITTEHTNQLKAQREDLLRTIDAERADRDKVMRRMDQLDANIERQTLILTALVAQTSGATTDAELPPIVRETLAILQAQNLDRRTQTARD